MVVGGVGAYVARRHLPVWINRFNQHRKSEQQKRQARRCDCLTVAFCTPTGRQQMLDHLRPHLLDAPHGAVLACPTTGVLLIDVPDGQRLVRVRGYDETRPVTTAPGQYL